jgi:glutamine amidotransferase
LNVSLFDYGVGNLHSLGKALQAEGARVVVTDDWARALSTHALVLPGVGSFAAAAGALPEDSSEIRDALIAGFPCLGICLGMQLLFDESEEGKGRGLGVVPGKVRRLRAPVVPQMGCNDVRATEDDPLLHGLGGLVAYYANSFVCEPNDATHALAWSEYGGDRFVAAVRRARTWGVQFHPEKSSTGGRRLLRNFLQEVERVRRDLGAEAGERAAPPSTPSSRKAAP